MRRGRRTLGALVAIAAAAALAGLGGCRTVTLRPGAPDDADALRTRIDELESENLRLLSRLAELEAQLASLERSAAAGDAPRAAAAASVPHVAEIAIGRLSHLRDRDDDGRPESLVVYVVPRDGLGRFVQLAGEIVIRASLVADDGGGIELLQERFEAPAVRAAYRSGMTGTHYTFDVPLQAGGLRRTLDERTCVVNVVYDDGRTGLRYSAEHAIDLSKRS